MQYTIGYNHCALRFQYLYSVNNVQTCSKIMCCSVQPVTPSPIFGRGKVGLVRNQDTNLLDYIHPVLCTCIHISRHYIVNNINNINITLKRYVDVTTIITFNW